MELTSEQKIVAEWFGSLVTSGYGPHTAIEKMLNDVEMDGHTWNLVNDQQFRNWLTIEHYKATVTQELEAQEVVVVVSREVAETIEALRIGTAKVMPS